MNLFKGIILVLAMLFLLVGCFDENLNQNDVTGENVENNNNENNNENNNDENKPNVNENFSIGEYNGNTYTNDFLGLKLNLPEEWKYSTDEEIADIMDLSEELANGKDSYEAKVAELTSVYYAVANNPNTGDNLSIISDKPIVDVTLDYYVSQLSSQLAEIDSVTYEIGEKGTGKLGNEEYTTLNITVPEYDLIQKYFIKKVDEYFIGVIITARTEDTVNEIVTYFE